MPTADEGGDSPENSLPTETPEILETETPSEE